jgi:hypothetical protein
MKRILSYTFVALVIFSHSTHLVAEGGQIDFARYKGGLVYFKVAGEVHACNLELLLKQLDPSAILLLRLNRGDNMHELDGATEQSAIPLEGISSKTFSYLSAFIHFNHVNFPRKRHVFENTLDATRYFGFTAFAATIVEGIERKAWADTWTCTARCKHNEKPHFGHGASRLEAWDKLIASCRNGASISHHVEGGSHTTNAREACARNIS